MIAVNSRGTARKIPTQRQARPTTYRLNKRGKLWLKIGGVFVIFLVGVGMGHSQGVKDGQGQIPATVAAQLTWCNAHSKTPCHAENGSHGWTVVESSQATVTDFNDGFSDSKRDDCQQGFKTACDWLTHTK